MARETYVKAIDNQAVQYPYTIGEFRADNKNTSFPKAISEETLAAYNSFPVTQREMPTYDQRTQYVESDTMPTLEGNAWVLGWTVYDKTPEEIQAYDDMIAKQVRGERDAKLYACDWTQLPDTALTPEQQADWATYREALRNISNQPDFPYNIVWPTAPSA
jgi:hypothetical protein